MLKEKRVQQVIDVATPHLQPGEEIELVTFGSVGSVSLKRRAVTAAVTAVASAGFIAVHVRPRRMYIALTSNRLLFFNGDTSFGKPGSKVLMSGPRDAIKVADVKKGLVTLKLELAVDGQEKGVKIVLPRPARDDGYKLAAALPSLTEQPV
jgi:hypothetical protein